MLELRHYVITDARYCLNNEWEIKTLNGASKKTSYFAVSLRYSTRNSFLSY